MSTLSSALPQREFAVKANNNVDELGKFYKIIEKEVKAANGKLIEHDERFDRIDAKFAEHDERFDRIQDGLRQQSSMLRQLLEKVS